MNSHTAITPPRNVVEEMRKAFREHYAAQPTSKFTPFPDPVGDDRDDYVRIIEVELWK